MLVRYGEKATDVAYPPQPFAYNRSVTDRKALLNTFRERLEFTVLRSGVPKGRFAEMTAIDRSTLSQLMSPTNRRLPRLETLVALATSQQVSIDWLVGLSNAGSVQAEMVPETMSFERDALTHNDERLIRWLQEAIGYKVRYVPSTLPDLLKTDAVIRFELEHFVASRPEQKIETAAARLAWTRRPETDLECCSSIQSIQGFAQGEGIWRELPAVVRREQLEHMARLTDELYPTLRWFLFDGLHRYAAPVTVFGPLRAALYVGQMYLVLTSAEHVRTFATHFDQLIRGAVLQPPEVPKFLRELATSIR